MNDTPVIHSDNEALTKTKPQRSWTTKEIQRLRELAPLGRDAVAEALDRSVRSVVVKAAEFSISLRRPGERRGLLMGQPRGVPRDIDPAVLRRVAELREDVLAGRVPASEVAEHLRRLGEPVELCPLCAKRPQQTEDGYCKPCHLQALADFHAARADEISAQRRLDAERQRKSRAARRRDTTATCTSPPRTGLPSPERNQP